MRRNKGNRVGLALRFAACCLLLFAFAGSAMAQNDPLYVIKYGNHYLSHVKVGDEWKPKDVNSFKPDSCLWHTGNTYDVTGNHHNYYFMDGAIYKYLSAPLQAGGALSLSNGKPNLDVLRNPADIYYFYDWDLDYTTGDGGGVARGKQYVGVSSGECSHSWCGGQCWEVYWIEYNDNQWKLTSESHYSRKPEEDCEGGGVPNAGLF